MVVVDKLLPVIDKYSFTGTKRSLRCHQCSAKYDDPNMLEQHKQRLHNSKWTVQLIWESYAPSGYFLELFVT